MTNQSLFCPRCATPNAVGRTVCSNCGGALPRSIGSPAAIESAAPVALQPTPKKKVKSPELGAALGFLLPCWGAFYNGRVQLGLVLFGLEIVFDGLSTVSAGAPSVIYHVLGGIMSYRWAVKAKAKALAELSPTG